MLSDHDIYNKVNQSCANLLSIYFNLNTFKHCFQRDDNKIIAAYNNKKYLQSHHETELSPKK